MKILTDSVLNSILESEKLQAMIGEDVERSSQTVKIWVKKYKEKGIWNPKLANPLSIHTLSKELKKNKTELYYEK